MASRLLGYVSCGRGVCWFRFVDRAPCRSSLCSVHVAERVCGRPGREAAKNIGDGCFGCSAVWGVGLGSIVREWNRRIVPWGWRWVGRALMCGLLITMRCVPSRALNVAVSQRCGVAPPPLGDEKGQKSESLYYRRRGPLAACELHTVLALIGQVRG